MPWFEADHFSQSLVRAEDLVDKRAGDFQPNFLCASISTHTHHFGVQQTQCVELVDECSQASLGEKTYAQFAAQLIVDIIDFASRCAATANFVQMINAKQHQFGM